jgi:Zn-finger nucleic acid-binding protein
MALSCPRCEGTKLEEIGVDEVAVDRCPRCAGVWFDHDEIGALVGAAAGLGQMESTVPKAPPEGSASPLCPRCEGTALRPLECTDRGPRQSVLQRCPSCLGTWIDRGELREQEDKGLFGAIRGYFALCFPPK